MKKAIHTPTERSYNEVLTYMQKAGVGNIDRVWYWFAETCVEILPSERGPHMCQHPRNLAEKAGYEIIDFYNTADWKQHVDSFEDVGTLARELEGKKKGQLND